MKTNIVDDIVLLLLKVDDQTCEQIARKTGRNIRTVRNRGIKLTARGWLKREKLKGDKRVYLYSLSDIAKKRIYLPYDD